MNIARLFRSLFISALAFTSLQASAVFINWADWETATTGSPETVTGTGVSAGESIDITYTGDYFFAQTGTGTDYFDPSLPYTDNAVVDNRPPAAEMIALTGGSSTLVHSVTFSEPVVNPLMAIVSLGTPSLTVTYEFIDEEFSILSSGTGFWGGAEPDSLFEITSSILTGIEGHGVIQFEGTYSTISWTVPTFESWHGFTFGFELLESQLPPSTGIDEPSALLLLCFVSLVFLRRRKA